MSAFTDAFENELLNLILGSAGAPYTPPGTWYLALFKGDPGDTGSITTEVSGGGYARKAITNNTTNFPTTVSGSKSLNEAVAFDAASAAWGTITHCGLCSGSAGANVKMYAALTTPQVINEGDVFRVAVGSGLVVTLD